MEYERNASKFHASDVIDASPLLPSQHRLFDTSSKENPRVVARPRKLEKNFKGNRLYVSRILSRRFLIIPARII